MNRDGRRTRIFAVILILLSLSTSLFGETTKTIVLGDETIGVTAYGKRSSQESGYPKVALVLSGGGARGFAHIPVIEALERAGIPVDLVLGTSMGSLVGGLYAAGYSPGDMRRLIDSYDMVQLFALSASPPLQTDPSPLRRDRDNLFLLGFDSGGLGNVSGVVGDQRILQMLNDSLSRVAWIDDFDQLAIPFRCIGTDLVTGERVVFSSGSLVTAIRSSISIPVVFTPYPANGRLIVDGGLVDNMPVDLAHRMGADIVIAVDVNAVDYQIAAEELESLTDVLSQLIVILTKNTVVDQSKDADMLVQPQLVDYGILDFVEVEGILAVGEEAAREHAEDIHYLTQEIALSRSLEVRDPNRYGPYFGLPDVHVGSVSHRSVGIHTYGDGNFDLESFSQFVGLPLDTVRKRQLNSLFDELRNSQGYATVTYDYTDVYIGNSDSVWGNLEVLTRRFGPKSSSIAAGISGSFSMVADPGETPRFRFLPDFSFRYTNRNFLDPAITLQVVLESNDSTTVSTRLEYALLPRFDVGLELAYAFGGIHPLNLRYDLSGTDDRDRMVGTQVFGQFRSSGEALYRLSLDMEYLWYGQEVVAEEALFTSIRFDGVYSTIPYRFFPIEGFRYDFSILAEIEDPFGYRLEGRVQKVFPLGKSDVIWVDLHAGSSHVSYSRKESFLEYGGSRGVPTYSGLTLVDDMVIARVKHLHRFSDQNPSLLLQSMFTLSSKGDTVDTLLNPTELFDGNHGTPFSSLSSVELSGSLALGLATPNIDLLFGMALDSNLRVALFLEVL